MVETPTAAVPAETQHRRPEASSLIVLAFLALATVPLLASAARIGPGWVPQGDEATITLRGDDLFTTDTPLLGMPSTVGAAVGQQVHHPGPLESQAIGLLGAAVDDPRTPLVAVTVVNLASVGVALLWARRLGGTALLAGAAAVMAALLWSLRGPILVTPFNPHVALLPYLATVVSLVAAWDRRPWAATSAVLFGSWAAQAHLTTTGPVAAAAVTALAVAVARWALPRWRGRPGPSWPDRRRVLAGAGALVACWAFPLGEAVAHKGGNVRALLRTSVSLKEETLGAGRAFHVVVNAVSLRPVWAQAGARPIDLLGTPSTAQYAGAAALGVVATVVALRCRREQPAVTAGVVLVAASMAAGGALTAKIPGSFFNLFSLHNYLWLWPASALLWVATAAGVVQLLGRRVTARPPLAVPLAAGLLVTAASAVAGLGPPHRAPATAASVYVRALSPQVLETLDHDRAYLIDLPASLEDYNLSSGLLYALERAGVDVRVPTQFEPSFGAHRVSDVEGRDTLMVQAAREPEPPSTDAIVVATYRPPTDLLERRERAEDAVVREVARRSGVSLADGDRIAPEDARAWVESGGFLAAADFPLIDQSLARLPASRTLVHLGDEPISVVTVYLLPTP